MGLKTSLLYLALAATWSHAADTVSPDWLREIPSTQYARVHGLWPLPGGDLIMLGYFEVSAHVGDRDLAAPTDGFPSDLFIARTDSGGHPRWMNPLAASHFLPTAFRVDGAGNSYIAGSFYCGSKVHALGRDSLDGRNCRDRGFVAKLDTAGGVVWARSANHWDDDEALAIAPMSDGGLVVAGRHAFFNPNDSLAKGMPNGIYVIRYDSQGKELWWKDMPVGGEFNAYSGNASGIAGVEADSAGDIYLAGSFATKLFGPLDGPTPDSLVAAAAADLFLVKLDGHGKAVFRRRMGGSGTDQAIALYRVGKTVVLAGRVARVDTLDSLGANEPPEDRPYRAVLAAYSASDGHWLWNTFIPGGISSQCLGLARSPAAFHLFSEVTYPHPSDPLRDTLLYRVDRVSPEGRIVSGFEVQGPPPGSLIPQNPPWFSADPKGHLFVAGVEPSLFGFYLRWTDPHAPMEGISPNSLSRGRAPFPRARVFDLRGRRLPARPAPGHRAPSPPGLYVLAYGDAMPRLMPWLGE